MVRPTRLGPLMYYQCGPQTHLPETAQVNMLMPGDKSRNKTVALPELYIMQVHPLLRHPDRLLVVGAVNAV
jgi:hypothetical protein